MFACFALGFQSIISYWLAISTFSTKKAFSSSCYSSFLSLTVELKGPRISEISLQFFSEASSVEFKFFKPN